MAESKTTAIIQRHTEPCVNLLDDNLVQLSDTFWNFTKEKTSSRKKQNQLKNGSHCETPNNDLHLKRHILPQQNINLQAWESATSD